MQAALMRTLRSIEANLAKNDQLVIFSREAVTLDLVPKRPLAWNEVVGAAALEAWLADAAKTNWMFLEPGDVLEPHALGDFAACPDIHTAEVLYGDEEIVGRTTKHFLEPWFKPRWNFERFLAQDYVSTAAVFRASVFAHFWPSCWTGTTPARELLLNWWKSAPRLSTRGAVHVPKIILQRRWTTRQQEWATSIQSCLGSDVEAVADGPCGTVRISWPLPARLPKVSVLLPTRDAADLLRVSSRAVLKQGSVTDVELIILDNGSVDFETFALFEELRVDPRVKIVSVPGPFNYSRINNEGAHHGTGDYLLLLNNDVQAVHEGWLLEMLRYAVRDEVGAVGPCLLYPDGSIQHAGVVVGLGNAAGHAHRFLSLQDCGYFSAHHVPQYVSAVTGAVLLVRKERFHAVGGLDEQAFPVAFNDVDFCLKLQRAGWRNVYAPQAVLLHHESKSRPKDKSPERRDRFAEELRNLRKRWQTDIICDENFHPFLNRASEQFALDYLRIFDLR